MRYYVLYVSHAVETLAENRETYGYNTQTEAIARFHAILSSAMSGTALNDALVVVVNSALGIERTEKWVRESTESEE